MSKTMVLEQLIEENNGYLLTSLAEKNQISRTYLKGANVRVKYVPKEIHGMGVCSVPSISGNIVRAHDKERCICELIKDRKKYEVQNFQTAVKDYMTGKEKNLSRLLEYAEKLKIRDEVMKYVEVLV